MQIGGIQKSLINLLIAINTKYDITLFLFSKHGEFLDEIPENVKVIEGGFFLSLLGISQKKAREKGIITSWIRGLFAFFSKIFNNFIPISVILFFSKRLKDFDIAISYMQNSNEKFFYGGVNDFVLKNIVATKKMAFVHCDFANYEGNNSHNRKIYKLFDKVVCVSKSCANSFIKEVDIPFEKVAFVPNFQNFNKILNKSNIKTVDYDKDFFNIITVSRLSEEKGLIRAIAAIENLHSKGYKLKWHILGKGAMTNKLKNYIKVHHLENTVFLYGEQKNPYRFMKNANLFLLPSYHESAPMVYGEAWTLKLPILTTDTLSAKEIVEENAIGVVCPNSYEGILDALKTILTEGIVTSSLEATNNIAMEKISLLLGGD